jgi:hypothetical protein
MGMIPDHPHYIRLKNYCCKAHKLPNRADHVSLTTRQHNHGPDTGSTLKKTREFTKIKVANIQNKRIFQ